MERQAALSILYDTLDLLAKIKIDLSTADAARLAECKSMMAREIDEAMANIHAAMLSVQENVARTAVVDAKGSAAA